MAPVIEDPYPPEGAPDAPKFEEQTGRQLWNTQMTSSLNRIAISKITDYALSTISIVAIDGIPIEELMKAKGPDGRAIVADPEELLPIPTEDVGLAVNIDGSVTIYDNTIQCSPMVYITSTVKQGYVSILQISKDVTRVFEWIDHSKKFQNGHWEIRDFENFLFEPYLMDRSVRRSNVPVLPVRVPCQGGSEVDKLLTPREVIEGDWGKQIKDTILPKSWHDVLVYANDRGLLHPVQKTLWRMEIIADSLVGNTGRDALAWFIIGLLDSENDLDEQVKKGNKFLGLPDGAKPISASDQSLTARLMEEFQMWEPGFTEATHNYKAEEQSNISGKARLLAMASFLGAVTKTQKHLVRIYHRLGVDLKVGKLRITDAKDDMVQWELLKDQFAHDPPVWSKKEFIKLARDTGFGDDKGATGQQAGEEKQIKAIGGLKDE